MRCACSWVLVVLLSVGCEGPGDGAEDAGTRMDSAGPCSGDDDCDDRLFCSGAERCVPGDPAADRDGCVSGDPPCAVDETCDEVASACEAPGCDDSDGDGHRPAGACGGDDCDDSDPNRYPGNVEVCDVMMQDEDCDPSSYGVRDLDGDFAPDRACCNLDGTTMRCGDDCDDARGDVHPGATETCNARDDDCDGTADEGAMRVYFVDADGDGYGVDGSEAMGCGEAPASAIVGGDCDDTTPMIAPSVTELCDGVDQDCDGASDEGVTATFYADVDMDGYGDPGSVMVACLVAPPSGYVLDAGDCDDTRAQTHPGAAELCDRLDNDCSSGGGVLAAEDQDDDRHTATLYTGCAGGFPRDDCRDDRATVYPGSPFRTTPYCTGGGHPCGRSCVASSVCDPWAPVVVGSAVSWDFDCDGVETPVSSWAGCRCGSRGCEAVPTMFPVRYTGAAPECGTMVDTYTCVDAFCSAAGCPSSRTGQIPFPCR